MAKEKKQVVVNQHDTTFQIHRIDRDSKVTISYDYNSDGKKPENNKMSSPGMPKEGFVRALFDLQAHAMFAAEIPVQYSGGISIRSVIWTKKGVKFVIAKKLKKSGTEAIIKSPEIELFNRMAKAQKHSLPEDAEECLNTLKMAAIAYIKGERSSGPMFDAQAEEDAKKETEWNGEKSEAEVTPAGNIISA